MNLVPLTHEAYRLERHTLRALLACPRPGDCPLLRYAAIYVIGWGVNKLDQRIVNGRVWTREVPQ